MQVDISVFCFDEVIMLQTCFISKDFPLSELKFYDLSTKSELLIYAIYHHRQNNQLV